jgi:hypothetical protein
VPSSAAIAAVSLPTTQPPVSSAGRAPCGRMGGAEGEGIFYDWEGVGDHALSAERHSGPRVSLRGVMVGLAVVAGSLLIPSAAVGQNDFEIQVYGSETVPAGSSMVELHSNVAAQGTTRTEDGVVPSQGAFHETIEITQGWTPWFETGFYLFTSIQPGGGWEWVGDHIRPRIRAPESWHLPVGLSLSTEIGYQQRSFSPDTWTLEIRPIIDKQSGPWYVSFNPVFDRAIQGQDAGRGFAFSPDLKISYEVTQRISAGIEYYGSLGPVSGFNPFEEQQQQIFPVIDLNLGPQWEVNAGVGCGLTSSTDRLVLKLILGHRFDWGRSERG